MGENDTTGWRDPTYGDRYDSMYADRIAAGGHVVAAYVDETEAKPVMDILAKQNPVSVNEEPNAAPTDAGNAAAGTMNPGTRPAGTVNVSRGDKEEVMPLAEEQVEVSKRRIEEPVRVRRYVVERPVEKTVNLADERVEIERRPASGAAPAGAFEEKVVETRAAHEEPVVNRLAKAAEEVVVRREEGERTETVRDTERKEQIEVERDGGQARRA